MKSGSLYHVQDILESRRRKTTSGSPSTSSQGRDHHRPGQWQAGRAVDAAGRLERWTRGAGPEDHGPGTIALQATIRAAPSTTRTSASSRSTPRSRRVRRRRRRPRRRRQPAGTRQPAAAAHDVFRHQRRPSARAATSAAWRAPTRTARRSRPRPGPATARGAPT